MYTLHRFLGLIPFHNTFAVRVTNTSRRLAVLPSMTVYAFVSRLGVELVTERIFNNVLIAVDL